MKNETARREIESLDYYLQNHTNDYSEESHTAMMMAIKALEQQPCEDCISREAVDEYITNLLSGYLYDEERTRLEDLTTYIWELPSVQPTRPTARWERFVDDYIKCSKCGEMVKFYHNYKHCPNCGSEMTESEDVR